MGGDLAESALDALRQGHYSLARDIMRVRANTHPREPRHYVIEGLALLTLHEWVDARDLFHRGTAAFPDNAQLWFNRALAEENLNTLAEAEASYRRTLSLQPAQGEAWGNLSNILRRTARFAEAEAAAHKAMSHGVPKAEALNLLALAQGKHGKFADAETALDEALKLDPDNVSFLANRANLAVDQLKFDEAWTFFAEARERDDNTTLRRDEGMARLLAGDYATGWSLYESRLDLPMALRLHPACARWQGEVLRGKKILLISEQGFGDTIQFCRYGQRLADSGAELVWVVRQPLVRLLSAHLPGRVIDESVPLPGADFWLPIISLPFALDLGAPEATAPYLHAPDTPQLPVTNKRRKIGLVWQGSPTHERDHERSIPLAQLAKVLRDVDAAFYAPFTGAGLEQITPDFPVTRLDDLIGDFADAAALMAQLDVLITVDTAAAHLAGALGVKTFLLLPHCPDWRWGVSSTTTPWYPSLTLLRQPRYGDWENILIQLLSTI